MAMSPRLLRPVASGFSPKNLSGLAGWWDASVAASLFQASNGTTAVTATDDPVGYWADQSGNGRNLTQSTNNNRPLYKPGTLNGKPVLDFDGSNDTLAAAFTLSQPVTILCVAQYKSNAASQGTLFDGGGGTGNVMRWFLPSNASYGMFAGAQISSGTLTVTGWHVFEAVFNSTSSSMIRNGTTLQTGNVGTATPGGVRLAVFGNGFSTPADVQFAEFVLYNRALSAAERGRVRKYLGNKYGLTVT